MVQKEADAGVSRHSGTLTKGQYRQRSLRLAEENQRLRDFLALVLETKEDHSQAPISPAPRDPSAWKVLFVGGHERLHAKLRKLMPRSTFLHPDRSQLDPSVLDDCDAVIYSVGYCSHTLVSRVHSVVRKRTTRVGYTNHVNVEMIVDDVRQMILGEPAGAVAA